MKSKIFCRKCIEDDENNDKLPTIYVFQLYTIYYYYNYKDLFTHKDINTYINGVVKICLNKFF